VSGRVSLARSTLVYVSYIRTTPEKLWSALTDAEFIRQYWFGVHGESQWMAGSSWKSVSPPVVRSSTPARSSRPSRHDA
jgi:uncharacterized protein YndB with AHSA1/START domain